MIHDAFPGSDLYITDPAQHIITAGSDLNDLDRDQSDLSDVCVVVKGYMRQCSMPHTDASHGRRSTSFFVEAARSLE